MGRFIYVFTLEGRDLLKEQGYRLVQANEEQKMFVFENNSRLKFNLGDKSKYMLSNTMLF